MSSNNTTSSREKIIQVADGRSLAYEDNGDATSSLVVIFFSGTLSVGRAERIAPVLASKGAHYIAPTLPGYGNTSPLAEGNSYAATIASDTSALLNHLHAHTQDLQLYIGGGSFGTVPAQMLYGASFEAFPQGRYLKGLLLLAGFPPLATKRDFDWTKHLSWPNWISVGPPARVLPFRITARLTSTLIASKLKSQESAEDFLRTFLFNKMEDEEKAMYKAWREKNGYEEDRLVKEMAETSLRSVAKSWEGLMGSAEVIYSDWWEGKKLEDLDEEHTANRSVLVVSGKGDDAASPAWSEFAASMYPNARLKWIDGGHISSLFQIDEIWEDFLGK